VQKERTFLLEVKVKSYLWVTQNGLAKARKMTVLNMVTRICVAWPTNLIQVKYDLVGMETVLVIQVFWVEENSSEVRNLKHGYC
jgi:hypothetical protein